MSPVVPAMFAVVSQDVEPAVIMPGLTETNPSGESVEGFSCDSGWTGFRHNLAAGDHGV